MIIYSVFSHAVIKVNIMNIIGWIFGAILTVFNYKIMLSIVKLPLKPRCEILFDIFFVVLIGSY